MRLGLDQFREISTRSRLAAVLGITMALSGQEASACDRVSPPRDFFVQKSGPASADLDLTIVPLTGSDPLYPQRFYAYRHTNVDQRPINPALIGFRTDRAGNVLPSKLCTNNEIGSVDLGTGTNTLTIRDGALPATTGRNLTLYRSDVTLPGNSFYNEGDVIAESQLDGVHVTNSLDGCVPKIEASSATWDRTSRQMIAKVLVLGTLSHNGGAADRQTVMVRFQRHDGTEFDRADVPLCDDAANHMSMRARSVADDIRHVRLLFRLASEGSLYGSEIEQLIGTCNVSLYPDADLDEWCDTDDAFPSDPSQH